jgi:DNA-binding NtrC family response regulator
MPSVLVIDDNEGCRAYLNALLSRSGYDVHELPDGRSIAAFLAATPVDAIITDLFMPGADGLETIRSVRQVAPRMPIIGITGAAWRMDDCYIRAMTILGAVAVLLKPLEGDAVLSALERAMVEPPPGESAPAKIDRSKTNT